MSDIMDKRIQAVREFCQNQIDYDARKTLTGMTNRAWCAQSVLNILNGLIDWQLEDE